MNWVWFHRFGSPPYFYRIAGLWAPWMLGIAVVLLLVGVYGGLAVAPVDYFQSEVYRIIYVHVPSAYLSLMTYTGMAIAAAIGLVWRIKITHAIAAACAPAGAFFTAVSLATGMIWGQPTWGTWWAWDPRIISQLFVLFFFLGYIGLRGAIEDRDRADRASAVLAIVGVVNVPIVHFSVDWWNSLHQAPTLMRSDGPTMPMSMAWPLLVMLSAYTFYFLAILLMRARAEVVRRERGGSWLREQLARPQLRPAGAVPEALLFVLAAACVIAVLALYLPGGGAVKEFLGMSGYGRYIWWAYAIALGGLALNILLARGQQQQAARDARRRLAMQDSP